MPRTSCSTTDGSASVDMSPSWSTSFAAILRRMRRMILPERVFGRPGAHWMKSGVAIGPDLAAHPVAQFLAQLFGRLGIVHERDVGVDALALDVVRTTDDGGFGDLAVRDQRALDLGRAEAMTGDVQHVVDATGDPVVAVLVAPRAVAREVAAGERAEVRVDEALVIAEHGAHLAGPAVGQHEVAFARAFERLRRRCRRSRAARRRTAASRSPASGRSRRAAG